MKNNLTITVLYGSDQVRIFFDQETLTQDEIIQYCKSYSFNSKSEAEAFILGIQEAKGWMELIYFKNTIIE